MKKNSERVSPDLSSLLVFGYTCKIFRDDVKARSLESGEHLIPWMGDPALKIDRFALDNNFVCISLNMT